MASIWTLKEFPSAPQALDFAQRVTKAGGQVVSIAWAYQWHVFALFHEQFQADEAEASDSVSEPPRCAHAELAKVEPGVWKCTACEALLPETRKVVGDTVVVLGPRASEEQRASETIAEEAAPKCYTCGAVREYIGKRRWRCPTFDCQGIIDWIADLPNPNLPTSTRVMRNLTAVGFDGALVWATPDQHELISKRLKT